ncbi:stationary phase growth adaptation protein [Vibrio cholerae]|uniref:stationary phase growth adaptation protein n=1 Tax=Vibrio cholerae TaxID=666 RepID=UPI001F2F3F2D|nr:stationary phase growth adaptation protein [Vibrio cholerae]MCU4229422.1 stationary phase growth adaptation protein [Vibrio cholerae]
MSVLVLEERMALLDLDKTTHWQPFYLDGKCYDLSHLDAHKVTYTQESDGKNPERSYDFYVTYSFHCFSKDYPTLTEQDREKLKYSSDKESRPFCERRYLLSKKLPQIINGLHKSNLVFHAGHESYATCNIEDENGNKIEYYVSFATYRYKKKLRIHIQSAYPLDTPLGKRKKVKFFTIAYNLFNGKALPAPQK